MKPLIKKDILGNMHYVKDLEHASLLVTMILMTL